MQTELALALILAVVVALLIEINDDVMRRIERELDLEDSRLEI